MVFNGTLTRHVDSIPWQDYRASENGMVLYYTTEPISEIPVREIPEEIPSSVSPDPHYETGTYGLYGCSRAKIRNTFVKSKTRYVFFMSRYVGTNVDIYDLCA